MLDRTPFYVESGGQVSDTGALTADGGRADVQAMSRLAAGGPRVHQVTVSQGTLRTGGLVTARVDLARRAAIRRNHTATHLLHAALRQTLGTHVKQAGSLVAPDRLRFDFVHTGTIAASDLEAIERIVNTQIMRNTKVQTTLRRTDEAMALGAMALFGEKYGDTVRVVDIPGFSLELCGGTHCRATGDIGVFTIVSEGGVAAGVRRVEAVTGEGAVALLQDERRQLQAVSSELHVTPTEAAETAGKLQAEIKRLTRALHEARVKAALGAGGDTASGQQTHDVSGVKVVTRRVDGVDRTALRELADQIKAGLGSGIVVLAADAEGKVSFVVSVTRGPDRHASRPVTWSSASGRSWVAAAAAAPTSPRPAARSRSRSTRCWRPRRAPCRTPWPRRWPDRIVIAATPRAGARGRSCDPASQSCRGFPRQPQGIESCPSMPM